jgi:hypothetical protein
MELKYRTQPDNLGGAAVPGVGTIHIDEIKPTLGKLTADLGFDKNLNDYVVGSTGKRDYSGDIDIIIDPKYINYTIDSLLVKLQELYTDSVVKRGQNIHLKYPIVDYDSSKNERLPRTGFVQIDFMFGDYEWDSFFYYNHGRESAYKSGHRNIAISSILGVVDTIESEEKDSFDRPVIKYRWKWSVKGFTRIKRISRTDMRTGHWNKIQVDEIIDGPYFDHDFIAKTIFKKDGKPCDLCSLETIIEAVKRNFDAADQVKIWQKIAKNFADWPGGNEFIYPAEISTHFAQDDK